MFVFSCLEWVDITITLYVLISLKFSAKGVQLAILVFLCPYSTSASFLAHLCICTVGSYAWPSECVSETGSKFRLDKKSYPTK